MSATRHSRPTDAFIVHEERAKTVLTRLARHASFVAVAFLGGALLLAAPAFPAGTPAWRVSAETIPTNLPSGGTGEYVLRPENVGSGATDGSTVTLVDQLPPGVSATSAGGAGWGCVGTTVVTCTTSSTITPGEVASAFPIKVAVAEGAGGSAPNTVSVSGGGAAEALSSAPTTIGSPAGFGFANFEQFSLNRNGSPDAQAGSHPYSTTTTFSLNNIGYPNGEEVVLAGEPKDLEVEQPWGFVGNPNATPKCPRALFDLGRKELQEPFCPADTRVGTDTVTIGTFNFSLPLPVYNLEPPPGAPAQFGFAYQYRVGFINFGVRTGKGYALTAVLHNIDQLHLLRNSLTLWNVPAEHGTGAPLAAPLLSNPTSCGVPLANTVSTVSWEEPGDPLSGLSYPWADSQGNPLQIQGCEALDFSPTIEAKPTTNLADSPSGFDFNLHIPQNEDPEGLAESHLKDAVVTLPEGLNVNPSSADGLAGCSEAQIGLHNDQAPSCPDASKLGTVEVETPLLEEPLHGAVYLASQNDNPFHSLLAGYIVAEGSGVLVKLPGRFETDPNTGRITASFKENPQLPFEDFKLHFFGGARGALRTPPTCGAFETTSDLTPWSTPELADAEPSDSFELSAGAGGSACIKSQGEEPHKPAFGAGTLNPTAGAYSPFLFKLSRADGSQELKGIDTTLPPGLVGKLAGISYCPEAALAAAKAKRGSEEKQSPSCPAASEVGTVNTGAGAGPNPIYVQGHAYLTGPYKGAPLSLAIITPAVAGPFDLGTVVVRTALNVDPETARIHAVSDPIPTILEGIPLDVRSIALHMDRPSFTLNPTSCNAMSVGASALSVLEQSASLSSRFQVGGCSVLGFKPKLSFHLKGGTKRGDHPAFTATLKARPGDANIARAQVTLPHSEFLDQGHIRTVCTRVQFAANQCPQGSVYGFAKAVTPLLDQPLEGPVYLRSSSHELPDLVASLGGQLNVVLAGHVDSIKGGIRNTFETVPDAPVTKFTLAMRGGKKGLLENSRDLCKSTSAATVSFDAQNGKVDDFAQPLTSDCSKHHKKHKHRGRGKHQRKHHG